MLVVDRDAAPLRRACPEVRGQRSHDHQPRLFVPEEVDAQTQMIVLGRPFSQVEVELVLATQI